MKTNQPNDALRYQRLLRGWSLQHVVDELCAIGIKANGKKPGVNVDMVSSWERGVKTPSPYYREKLCLLYGIPANQLNLIPLGATQLPTTLIFSRNLVDDMDKKRREVVRLLTIAGAALVLPFPDLDWERIDDALDTHSHLDQKVIANIEGINSHLWSLYLTTSTKSSVLDGVAGQLNMLVQFLREPQSAPVHKRLCMLISDLTQLEGEIYFDQREYEMAQSCYVLAASAAKEVQAYDLWACALVRHSFLSIYDERPRYGDALPFLQGARRLAERGDSLLPTRYWAAAVEAEAESGIHNLAACQDALERAHGVLEQRQASPAWTRFDSSRLPALRGACYVRLEEPTLAIPALQEALKQFPKVGRKRGMVLLDLATAAAQSRDIEQSHAYLDKVVDIANLSGSSFLYEGISKVHQQLEAIQKRPHI